MIKYTVVVAFFSFFLEQALVSQIGQPNICLKTDEKELCVLEKMQDVFLAIGHNIQTKYRASCHKTLQGCISYGLYSRERRQDSGLKGRCIDDKSLGFYVYSMMKRQRSVISPVYCDFVVFLRVGSSNMVARGGVAAHPMDTPCLVQPLAYQTHFFQSIQIVHLPGINRPHSLRPGSLLSCLLL